MVEKVGVVCTDVDELAARCLAHRGYAAEDSTILIGLDDGQSILKVCSTIQPNDNKDDKENKDKERLRYAEGVAAKKLKPSSVKKLLILAAFPGVPEEYENLKQILEEVKIEALEFSVSADIKRLLLIIGKPAGKPTSGCPFCNMESPYTSDKYQLYTLGDLLQWHQKYEDAGKPHKKQKEYNNVINPPLLSGPLDRRIIEFLNIPSLHLFLGNCLLLFKSSSVNM